LGSSRPRFKAGLLPFLLPLLPIAAGCAAQDEESSMTLPQTTAERSGFTETTRHADVRAFLDAVLSSGAPRTSVLELRELGRSHEGRILPLVVAADPALPEEPAALAADPRLRIFVNANIHPGEVEGKEAMLQLVREIAEGRHDAWLEHVVLFVVPNFNADGNERIDVKNRVAQNGPVGGVGVRPNAQGLDLNRDFVKLESPEVRALVAAMRQYDPHLLFDLHTTNGSYHGYHLTYASSLSTNADPALDHFAREELLEVVRARLVAPGGPGFRTFDYGNFRRGEPERGWATYDHRARYGTNYYGLRQRIPVLSEAYSYVDYETRIQATYAFVTTTIERAIEERDTLRRLCAQADARWLEGPRRFGYDSELGPAETVEVLSGEVVRTKIEGLGTRIAVTGKTQAHQAPVQDHFVSKSWLDVPAAWLLVDPPTEVLQRLEWHGIVYQRLERELEIELEDFVIERMRKRTRPFQGHLLVELQGSPRVAKRKLPAGAYIVPSRQRLGRLAAQLLDPVSEDSLTTWNFFDAQLPQPGAAAGAVHPVRRLRGDLPD
jgi:hypothetical protein